MTVSISNHWQHYHAHLIILGVQFVDEWGDSGFELTVMNFGIKIIGSKVAKELHDLSSDDRRL